MVWHASPFPNALLIFLIAVLDSNAGIRIGAPTSPVTYEPSKVSRADQVIPQGCELEELALSGVKPRIVGFVELSDVRDFGSSVRSRIALLADYQNVPVRNPSTGDSSSVDLLVAYSADLREVLVAFTPLHATAVLPMYPERNYENEATQAGWLLEKVEGGGIGRDLGGVWAAFGWEPAQIGQLIIRPRRVTCRFPPGPVGSTPAYDRSPAWVVEARGLITRAFGTLSDGTSDYYSCFLGLVDDESKVLFQGRFLP